MPRKIIKPKLKPLPLAGLAAVGLLTVPLWIIPLIIVTTVEVASKKSKSSKDRDRDAQEADKKSQRQFLDRLEKERISSLPPSWGPRPSSMSLTVPGTSTGMGHHRRASSLARQSISLSRPPLSPRTLSRLSPHRMSRQHSQSQSPLLALPHEIRARILTYAIGGKTVHIIRPPERISHVICFDRSTRRARASQNVLPTAEHICYGDEDTFSNTYNGPYSYSRTETSKSTNGRAKRASCPTTPGTRHTKLTQIWLVNQQLALEALPILYGSNTFDFIHTDTLSLFAHSVPDRHLDRIRSLRMTYWLGDLHRLSPPLVAPTISSLRTTAVHARLCSGGAQHTNWDHALSCLIAPRFASLKDLVVVLDDTAELDLGDEHAAPGLALESLLEGSELVKRLQASSGNVSSPASTLDGKSTPPNLANLSLVPNLGPGKLRARLVVPSAELVDLLTESEDLPYWEVSTSQAGGYGTATLVVGSTDDLKSGAVTEKQAKKFLVSSSGASRNGEPWRRSLSSRDIRK